MLLSLLLFFIDLKVPSNPEYDRFLTMVTAHRALVLSAAVHEFGSSSVSVVYVDPGAATVNTLRHMLALRLCLLSTLLSASNRCICIVVLSLLMLDTYLPTLQESL